MAFNHVGNCDCPVGDCCCGDDRVDPKDLKIGHMVRYKQLSHGEEKFFILKVIYYDKRTGATVLEHESGLITHCHSSWCKKIKQKSIKEGKSGKVNRRAKS